MTEHPVRCSATLDPFPGDDHAHSCAWPAKVPQVLSGILEHECHCGMTWEEMTPGPPQDKSWLQMESVGLWGKKVTK